MFPNSKFCGYRAPFYAESLDIEKKLHHCLLNENL